MFGAYYIHYGLVGPVQKKMHNAFIYFFFVFHHKTCVFMILIPFFIEVSNFCNIIVTNQKHEWVFPNCQWNCMLVKYSQHTGLLRAQANI